MNNLFAAALKTNETNSFFRGEKNYFVRTTDFDQHNHGANLGGHVESFLKASNDNAEVFDDAFIKFLESLEVTKEDLTHFMANLSAFFALKNRDRLEGSTLFRSPGSNESKLVKSYLTNISNTNISNTNIYLTEKDRLYIHANFISKNGNDILLNTLKEIDKG
ncbi:hypothetical protein J8L73_12995 [Pseudoalteromonas sp. MMG006]|uniref:hypothetical protein n=1 Tax=Pseudoalteromonas sp. MMG006 TaxID=2822683 RepID=UPI001B38C40B|nr:hypothetical protein [Pseudoalteromonas sp. MMG006]MBQ4800039.1 hypothetical protein [Pseudoalteromonas sp. MMG006]